MTSRRQKKKTIKPHYRQDQVTNVKPSFEVVYGTLLYGSDGGTFERLMRIWASAAQIDP